MNCYLLLSFAAGIRGHSHSREHRIEHKLGYTPQIKIFEATKDFVGSVVIYEALLTQNANICTSSLTIVTGFFLQKLVKVTAPKFLIAEVYYKVFKFTFE